MKNSTGRVGADARGRSTWHGERGARRRQRHQQPRDHQQIDERRPADDDSATAPASARPATVSPATRAAPRRSTPYQAARAGDQHAARRTKPRGNSLTATATASTTVAAPTTSATIAASRRLIGSPSLSADVEAATPVAPAAWIEDAERLDLAIYAAIARTPTPALDVAMSRLSRAADYSRLSLASAALLALGRRKRPAAARPPRGSPRSGSPRPW